MFYHSWGISIPLTRLQWGCYNSIFNQPWTWWLFHGRFTTKAWWLSSKNRDTTHKKYGNITGYAVETDGSWILYYNAPNRDPSGIMGVSDHNLIFATHGYLSIEWAEDCQAIQTCHVFFPRHSEFHRHDVGLHPTWKIWSSNFQDIRFAEDGDLGKTIWNTCQYIRLSGPLGHWWNILGIEVNDLGYGWSYLDLPLIQKIGTKNNWT